MKTVFALMSEEPNDDGVVVEVLRGIFSNKPEALYFAKDTEMPSYRIDEYQVDVSADMTRYIVVMDTTGFVLRCVKAEYIKPHELSLPIIAYQQNTGDGKQYVVGCSGYNDAMARQVASKVFAEFVRTAGYLKWIEDTGVTDDA